MKQIDDKKLCHWCMGCMNLEDENFIGVMRCNNFMAGQADWEGRWKEVLKNGNKQ